MTFMSLHHYEIHEDLKSWTPADVLRLNRRTSAGVLVYSTRSLTVSLLRSRFLGCHATLPLKKRLLTSEPHSFPFVFVVYLRSVEQTNHIIAKCEWRKLSREKVCGANTRGISGFCFTPHVAKNRRCSQVAIMTDEKNCKWKSLLQVLHVLIAMFSYKWDNVYFLEMSNCKRQSRAKRFLQIVIRPERPAFRTRCQQIERSYLISWFLY